MAFSSVLGASSVVKPGVVTTATRPSSPFVGQLIYDTTVSTVLAWNGSAWIGTGGLTRVYDAALSSTSVTADGIFTSAYSNYLLLMRYTTVGNNAIYARLRASGTSNSSANYNQQLLAATTTVPASALISSDTSIQFCTASYGDYKSSCVVNLFSPAVAEPTNFQITNNPSHTGYTAVRLYTWMGNHSVATAYDGIELFCAGTMAGTFAVYGYSKTV